MKNRIQALRKEKGMSQIRLSIELGVAQETVSAYEKAKHYPSFSALLRMSEIFDASVDYIMGLSTVRKNVLVSELSNEEISFLFTYRKMEEIQRQKAMAFIQGLMA